MSRTREFDREAVTAAALAEFWRVGFDNASIPELEAATGLSRSSIYNTFGSKRGLFDAAVSNYLNTVVRPLLHPLQEEAPAAQALADYLNRLHSAFHQADSMPARNGCLLLNTAGSPVGRDHQIARIIADYRAELNSAIANGVRAALPDARPDRQQQLTDTITALVISAFVLARIDADLSASTITTARDLVYSNR